MWNTNKFCEQLGLTYPIIQAGMAGGVTTPELVSSVSIAGALGTLGAGYMTAEDMTESIIRIKQLTNHMFAVNVFIPEDNNLSSERVARADRLLDSYRRDLQIKKEPFTSTPFPYDAQLESILELNVPIVSFTFGVPSRETVKELKKNNVITIGTATTVEEAVINEDRGVDAVVVQGSEAGGHRGSFTGDFSKGMVGTIALVPQAVDQVRIPVIAAGGIMDGRGVLASLALGAQGVQMGTAFVTSQESGAKVQHKEAILKTTESETVVTSVFSGKPARGIRNQFISDLKEFESELPGYPDQNSLTKPIRKEAAKQNKPEWMSLWSGQAPRLSTRKSATELIDGIVRQVEGLIQEKW
ncbi:nitronate monooxygenase [Halobacillus rhizosphaerae]|uniref:NAD(P)H-dependent flavin oxidoreductase n=1 Tax=Halobacillus rhizosphaerae TaxID=3064889 RepID=UPI00398AC96C